MTAPYCESLAKFHNLHANIRANYDYVNGNGIKEINNSINRYEAEAPSYEVPPKEAGPYSEDINSDVRYDKILKQMNKFKEYLQEFSEKIDDFRRQKNCTIVQKELQSVTDKVECLRLKRLEWLERKKEMVEPLFDLTWPEWDERNGYVIRRQTRKLIDAVARRQETRTKPTFLGARKSADDLIIELIDSLVAEYRLAMRDTVVLVKVDVHQEVFCRCDPDNASECDKEIPCQCKCHCYSVRKAEEVADEIIERKVVEGTIAARVRLIKVVDELLEVETEWQRLEREYKEACAMCSMYQEDFSVAKEWVLESLKSFPDKKDKLIKAKQVKERAAKKAKPTKFKSFKKYLNTRLNAWTRGCFSRNKHSV